MRQAHPAVRAPDQVGPGAGPAAARAAAGGTHRLLRGLVALVRPAQWVKNVLVVPFALLSIPSWTAGTLTSVGWSVVAFTLASAVVYVVNDIADRDRDRLHPVKRRRPVASGAVPVAAARLLAVTLLVPLALVVTTTGPVGGFWPIGVYLAVNLAYSRGLKHVALLDVFMLAAGFVLRTVQGWRDTGFEPSPWLLVCVLSGSLLLGLGKRRHELAVGGERHRPALSGYSVGLVDQLLVLNAAVTVMAYLLFVDADLAAEPYRSASLLVSAPFALFALCRYLQVLLVQRQGGSPLRILLRDRAMVVNSLLWAAGVGAFLLAAHHPQLVLAAG